MFRICFGCIQLFLFQTQVRKHELVLSSVHFVCLSLPSIFCLLIFHLFLQSQHVSFSRTSLHRYLKVGYFICYFPLAGCSNIAKKCLVFAGCNSVLNCRAQDSTVSFACLKLSVVYKVRGCGQSKTVPDLERSFKIKGRRLQ